LVSAPGFYRDSAVAKRYRRQKQESLRRREAKKRRLLAGESLCGSPFVRFHAQPLNELACIAGELMPLACAALLSALRRAPAIVLLAVTVMNRTAR